MDALKLLTLDCWREVLDRVKNPEDLKACSETCVIFQELLTRKMNVFLFDLIIPKIFDYLPVEAEEASLKPVYDCRAVCKGWCKSVDSFAETADSKRRLFEYWFDNGDTTQRFLNMFAQHAGNPFVGRRVGIEHRSNVLMAPPPQEYCRNEGLPHDDGEILHITKIRQLLSRFGKEIWALKLFENVEHQHLALCKNIPIVLSQLPNLRELQVGYLSMMVHQGNMDELPAYIAANPLPPLPHLERVYIPHLNQVMVGLILQKYAPQLKYLTIGWDPSRFPEALPRFSILNELYLDFLDASESLQGLRQLHSPLKRLNLVIQHNRDNLTVWPIDELFRNIQHLPIENLDLYLQTRVFLAESVPTSPELRARNMSIRAISVSCSSDNVSWNFLLYCPNLAIFQYTHRPIAPGLFSGPPGGVAELLDVTGLIKENRYDMFYESNIWEMVPSLQSLYFNEFDVVDEGRWICFDYFRKAYEEKRKI